MANMTLRIGSSVNQGSNRDYVYNDVNSSFKQNGNKTNTITNLDASAVLGALKNLFEYSPGERVLEPDFGMDFSGLLYEPMNRKTAEAIGYKIYNSVKEWEPRLRIISINVEPDEDDNTYYVTMNFTIDNLSVDSSYQFTYELMRNL